MLDARWYRQLAGLVLVTALLQGCAANDRRTLGSQIDDNSIAVKAGNLIEANKTLDTKAHINVNSYNGVVLLTGQAPDPDMGVQAEELARTVQGVKDVQNQIRVSNPISFATRSRDSWITTRVKSMLLADKEISGLNIRVVTENGEVFLMGIVSELEANKAVEIARHVNGVIRVVKAFEIRYD